MTVTEFLKTQVPFLAGLTEEDARALGEAVVQQTFKPGYSIIRQGITVDGLHVIAAGKVSVWVKPLGKQPVEVAKLGPGDVFGERSIIEFGVAGATIKSLEECLIFIIHQNEFLRIMEANPALKDFFLKQIEARRKPLASNPAVKPPEPPAPPAAPPPPKPA